MPDGSLLRTDAHTRAYVKLADGTHIALDRSTKLALVGSGGRQARLEKGAIVADVAHIDGQTASFAVPHGSVRVLGTKFSLRADDRSSAVAVSRGSVELSDNDGRKVSVRAGEEGRLFEKLPPYVSAAPGMAEALAWSESATAEPDPERVEVRGLGELSARKPGSDKEIDHAVSLSSHSVKVRIAGSVARTEVDETFTNNTNKVLEGIYRFPLPPDAKIERLALEVNGKMEEGAFVDRDRAAAIWRGAIVNAAPQMRQRIHDEIVWVPGPWHDPALLEWQRGGRFELKIYPIPKKGSRRVVLAYTQVVKPTGGVRRYTYPLAYDPGGSTRIGQFKVDVEVRGNDTGFGVRARGYELSHASTGRVDRLTMSADNFVPSGDLGVEYALPDRDKELSAWAYQPSASDNAAKKGAKDNDDEADDTSSYVAIALRPRLPRAASGERHRVLSFVVDSSRSMFGERYRRATALTARVLRELDPRDRFTVLACDTTCRVMPGGLREPSAQSAGEARRFLESVTPEGGSDPTAAVKSARKAASDANARELKVVYIGDGTPTVGAIRPAYITGEVEDALPAGRGSVTAVAIGADADSDSLQAMARAGAGVVVPYAPGQSTAEAAYAVLGATYGATLSDVKVKLPDGLVAVAPRKLDTIPAGGESFVVARMTKRQLSGSIELTGKVGKQPFEQRYPLHVSASRAKGNAFVPRLYAALRIGDLERASTPSAKKEAIHLSSEFNVASRYTSLLALESKTMFRAFGLDQSSSSVQWTGEDEAEGTASSGELALDDADDEAASGALDFKAKKSAGPLAMGGAGIGHVAARRHRAMHRPAAKPAPRPDTLNPFGDSASSETTPPNSTKAPASQAFEPPPPHRWAERRRMVPMRRVWQRHGSVTTERIAPKAASMTAIADAERAFDDNKNSRSAVKKLYTLYELAGQVDRAGSLAELWSKKDPLDPGALTARADMAAERGDRAQAIRVLGSVVDVRPGDVASQKRLARLERWAGHPELGCRFSLAIAQLHAKSAKLLAEAVRCGRATGDSRTADAMLAAADDATEKRAQALLDKPATDLDSLRGDLKLEATWSGDNADLDLALLHPDGDRVSWLGAPTRSVITARDVKSTHGEGLALRGAKPGEYVIELTRVSGSGPVHGQVVVSVAGTTRTLHFVLDGKRKSLGIARVAMRSRLVPLGSSWRGRRPVF